MKYNMSLNPVKWNFEVRVRKFLGYMLTKRGIEVNHEKCREIP